ncbi:hypothetical protein [Embleya sp. NPDC005575]|uniref:hypothetical protein n=1 Tax=Embleya sp. NPDC005575 TaxID=3156892 RepID=UPI0033BB7610
MGTNGVDSDRLAGRDVEGSAADEAMTRALVWLSDAYRRSAPADGDHRVRADRTPSRADGPDTSRR